MTDDAVIAASAAFVRVILRDPHTEEFAAKHAKGEVPLPGLVVLDAEGKIAGACDLKAAESAAVVADVLTKHK